MKLSVVPVPVTAQNNGAADLLCFSHLRWDFVYQRPQHLMKRCAMHHRVFFWEEPISDLAAGVSSYVEILSRGVNLWVLRPHLSLSSDSIAEQRSLLRAFLEAHEVHRFVRWYYTPMALEFSADLHAAATVYDCMDELSAFAGAPPELLTREQELLRVSDVVFTGGISLYEVKRVQHTNVHSFPSSIDRSHFAQNSGI